MRQLTLYGVYEYTASSNLPVKNSHAGGKTGRQCVNRTSGYKLGMKRLIVNRHDSK